MPDIFDQLDQVESGEQDIFDLVGQEAAEGAETETEVEAAWRAGTEPGPKPAPGVIRSFGRGFAAPFRAAGMGPGALGAVSDELLAAELERQQRQREEELPPGGLATLAGMAGGIGGSLAQYLGSALITRGPSGPMAAFGSAGAYDAFIRAGVRALEEGKDIGTATEIGKGAAGVGQLTGVITALALPSSPVSTLKQAALRGLPMAAVGGGATIAENIAERGLGLETPITEGALESAAMMGVLPPAAHVAGLALRGLPGLPRVRRPAVRTDRPPAEAPPAAEPAAPPVEIPAPKEAGVSLEQEVSRMQTWPLQQELMAAEGRPKTPENTAYIEMLNQELERRRSPKPAAEQVPTTEPPARQSEFPESKLQLYDPDGPIELVDISSDGKKALVKPLGGGPQREVDVDRIIQMPRRGKPAEPAKTAEDLAYEEAERAGMQQDPDIAAAAESNKKLGLPSDVVISDTMPDGNPWAPQNIATVGKDGKIYINPKEFAAWTRRRSFPKTPEGRARAIRSLLGEEGIHSVAKSEFTTQEMAGLWNGLTSLERGITNLAYTGKIKGDPRFDVSQMGHEYLRRVTQRLLKMTTREVAEAAGKEWLKQATIDLIDRLVVAVRRKVGGRATVELNYMLAKLQRNLGVARRSIVPRGTDVFPFAQGKEEHYELPLTDYKGPLKLKDIPITVQRADGTTYEAYLNGFWNFGGKEIASIGKVRLVGSEMVPGLSHTVLDQGETIINGPRNRAEHQQAIAKKTGAQPAAFLKPEDEDAWVQKISELKANADRLKKLYLQAPSGPGADKAYDDYVQAKMDYTSMLYDTAANKYLPVTIRQRALDRLVENNQEIFDEKLSLLQEDLKMAQEAGDFQGEQDAKSQIAKLAKDRKDAERQIKELVEPAPTEPEPAAPEQPELLPKGEEEISSEMADLEAKFESKFKSFEQAMAGQPMWFGELTNPQSKLKLAVLDQLKQYVAMLQHVFVNEEGKYSIDLRRRAKNRIIESNRRILDRQQQEAESLYEEAVAAKDYPEADKWRDAVNAMKAQLNVIVSELNQMLPEGEGEVSFPEAFLKPEEEKRQGQGMLPLTPGVPGEKRPAAAEMGAMIPEPPSQSQVSAIAARELSKPRPSFSKFQKAVVEAHGDQAKPMLAGAWEEQVWQKLSTASGKEIAGLLKQYEMEKQMGRSYRGEIADAPTQAKVELPIAPAAGQPIEYVAWKEQVKKLQRRGALDLSEPAGRQRFREMGQEELRLRSQIRREQNPERRQELENRRMELQSILTATARLRREGGVKNAEYMRMLERERAQAGATPEELASGAQKVRNRAIARIGEKLIAQSQRRGAADLRRPSISSSDIGWHRGIRAGVPAWHEFTPEQLASPDLQSRLVESARVGEASITTSLRVTAVRDNLTGEVWMLSTYNHPEGGVMIAHPERTGQRVHVPLRELTRGRVSTGKPRYEIIGTALLEEPAMGLQVRFRNEQEWRDLLADDAQREMARREESEAERASVPGMEQVEAEGRAVIRGEEEELIREPSTEPERVALQTGQLLTDAEARALHEHFASQNLRSRQDVEDLFDALRVASSGGRRPTGRIFQIANALDKMWRGIQDSNPDLSPEEAVARTLDWIYENAGTEADRSRFVQKAMGHFAPESVAIPGAGAPVPPPETGARELTMLGRKPPTIVPGQPVPKGPGPRAFLTEPETPQAFLKDAATETARLAELATLRPMRVYSEWMVDRLRRVGGVMSRQLADVFNGILDREHRLYGQLTPSLDRARRYAGQFNEATRWLHGLIPITSRTATARSVPAIEGNIAVPAYAQRTVAMAQQANIEIGQMVEPVVPGFQAGGAFQRNLNAFGYDVIREGAGRVWMDWTEGLAAANGLTPYTVRQFFRRWKAALDEPGIDTARIEAINQDFARQFPRVVTHVRVGPNLLARWEPVMHADLFNYLENAARRATYIRSFREAYPVGSPMLQATLRASRAELPPAIQKDLDGIIRALQGHPTDTYSNGLLAPGNVAGQALRFANQTAGNLMARMVLTGQMMTQAGETAAGATPIFLGYDNYLDALIRVRQLYPQLELQGAVNPVIYDMSFNPTQRLRSFSRIAGNAISRVFGEPVLNELQEALASATARVVTEKIQSGNLSNWERSMLPMTFRAMGFTPAQASQMIQGNAKLLGQFENKAASWLTSGNKAIAEGSRLGANRLFNSLFRFQSYPMMKMNQFLRTARIVREAWTSGTNAEKLASARLMTRFLFGTSMQGVLTVGVAALFYEGLYGAKIRAREAMDETGQFALEAFLSSIGGPLYLVYRGAKQSGVAGIGEQAKRMFFPYTMVTDLWDMTQGQGQYRDLDTMDRIGKYVSQKVPGTRAIAMGLSVAGLSQKDTKMEAAMKGFFRWRRDQLGFRTEENFVREDDRREFRIAMRKAVTALQNGDAKGYREAVADAMTAPGTRRGSIKASLKSRRLLQFNGKELDADQLESLRRRIGEEPVTRLQYFDRMLERAAEGTMLPPYE